MARLRSRCLLAGRSLRWFGGLSGLTLTLGMAVLPVPARALGFDFFCDADPGCSSFNPQAYAGFQAAAARWSALFSDPFTVRLQIGYRALDPGILGQAGSSDNTIAYAAFRTLLGLDRLSTDDFSAFASLTPDADVDLWLNYTSNNPNGLGSSVAYLDNDADANNTTLRINTANLKAVGATPDYTAYPNQVDAVIEFSTGFTWDFDPSDGVAPGAFDFIGVAAHEIGHALGFVSGVDILDYNSPYVDTLGNSFYYSDDQFDYVTSLDLFRYSNDSAAIAGGVNDWTAGPADKYFSLDRGATSLGAFATGFTHGDGRQASHWKDNLALGLMDPTLGTGELAVIRPLDVRSLDVIGYNLQSLSNVPAPLPLLAAAAAHAWSRRQRQRLREARR